MTAKAQSAVAAMLFDVGECSAFQSQKGSRFLGKWQTNLLLSVLSNAKTFAPFLLLVLILYRVVAHDYVTRKHLRLIPGPLWYALTRYRLALDAWRARSIHSVHALHLQYGTVVRIGPNEVSFNSLSALKQIYGAGSPFERTAFYSLFDVYGRPNLFTFSSGKDHRERKKLLSHIYANQTILSDKMSAMVQSKAAAYLTMIEREPDVASEIFSSLHYYSIDAISEFVYGPHHGRTRALKPSHVDRKLLDDILVHSRRRLSWFAVHFPDFTKWLTTRTGLLDWLITILGLLPMNRPFTYSGIREHALKAFFSFKAASPSIKTAFAETTVIGRLVECQKAQELGDMDIASECADHLLAGIDTTADTLMFLVWALSRPCSRQVQEKLRVELLQAPVNSNGVSSPKHLAQLSYLNAVIKEVLRLYAPLPAFEPRVCLADTVIDGYHIPAGTVVGMSPYCLHHEASIFPDPLTFEPERWMAEDGALIPESDQRNRWFWAFSSGARMCIGMHLANAEMYTLTAAIYSKYSTSLRDPDASPGITSRYEVFYDETFSKVVEHECWVNFEMLPPKT